MKNWRYLKIVIALLCLTMVLSACQGTEHPPKNPETQAGASAEDFTEEEPNGDTEDAGASEENPPDISLLPETEESPEPQSDFRAQYIGRTVGDVVQLLGNEYTVDHYEGSTMIGYPGNLWFLFGSTEDTITDDLIIRQMITSEQYPAVYELTGSMTYPEILDAVDEETDIPQPASYYSEADDENYYTLEFTYREYHLLYTWLDDPENTPSASVYVLKQDVESMKPVDSQLTPESPEKPDRDNDLSGNENDLFCGPDWFEGVMGSRFYVPDGFVQQDITPAIGHYYLFKNDELDMSISVHEMTFMMLGIDSTAMVDEYTSRESDDSVTYAASGENFYVVSGQHEQTEDTMIYYDRVDYDDMFRYEVSFQYPASQSEEGEKILLEFFKNYSVS